MRNTLSERILQPAKRGNPLVHGALDACTALDLPMLHQCYAKATGDWRRAAIARRIGELSPRK